MQRITRRDLIKRLALGLCATNVLVACASSAQPRGDAQVLRSSQQPEQPDQSATAAPSQRQEAQPEDATAQTTPQVDQPAELDCEVTEGLTQPQINVREALEYTDETPRPGQTCDNCELWVDAPSADTCGGCQTVPGPIHPKGWCSAWVRAR